MDPVKVKVDWDDLCAVIALACNVEYRDDEEHAALKRLCVVADSVDPHQNLGLRAEATREVE